MIEDMFSKIAVKDSIWGRLGFINVDIYEAFQNRINLDDDNEIIARIVNAYNLAVEKQSNTKNVYRVSNGWEPIYKKYLGHVMALNE